MLAREADKMNFAALGTKLAAGKELLSRAEGK
jgi:hypothetical protein